MRVRGTRGTGRGQGSAGPARTCSMSICTRPTMLTTLLSRRPVCFDWNDESRMLERRLVTRPRKGKRVTWAGMVGESEASAGTTGRWMGAGSEWLRVYQGQGVRGKKSSSQRGGQRLAGTQGIAMSWVYFSCTHQKGESSVTMVRGRTLAPTTTPTLTQEG